MYSGMRVNIILYLFSLSEASLSQTPSIHAGLSVTIDIDYTPPPDFVGGPNDYRAASSVTLTCQVERVTQTVSYDWTTTLSLFNESTLRRDILHSDDTGNHTCTVTDRSSGLTGRATIEMNIVGE